MINDNKVQFIETQLGESVDKLLEFPMYINIETINMCNARCVMCGIDFDNKKKMLMPDQIFNKITEEISEYVEHVRKVNLYLDCEPLMDKHLHESIHRLKCVGVSTVNVATNASILFSNRAVELIEAGLDEIYISIDSLSKAKYEAIRKRLKFENVYNNTLELIKIRNQMKSNLSIRIQMVAQEMNFGEEEAFVNHWTSLLNENDKVVVHKAHNWGNKVNVATYEEDAYINEIPCSVLWSNACIHSDGSIALCSVDTEACSIHSIGSLNDSSINEIWHGFHIDRIRMMHLAGNREQHSLCNGCTAWREIKNVKYHLVKIGANPVNPVTTS